MLTPSTTAPAFRLTDQFGHEVALTDRLGRWVVLWWYPEAGSSGCSVQAASLQARQAEIEALGADVLGVSFNSGEQNDAFSCDYALTYPLLSDVDQSVGTTYDVVRGPGEPFADKPRRITYVIDPDGTVALAELVANEGLGDYGPRVVQQLNELIAARSAH